MKKKRRKLQIGDTITCHDRREFLRVFYNLSASGVDIKPTGELNQLVICGFDKRKK